ncbi:phospholipase A2 inhibitor NAI-like [Erythrolamprus reginae]|uniref:phospholipase A2 inhibitor NAI-like n=1 Tax=Erythrolamprus reginae TaxID=121349 RepID=UPI00396C5FF0
MRAAGILVLCVFSYILSTGASLKCKECVGLRNECEKWSVKEVECKEKETFCSTTVFNSTINSPLVSHFITKGCSKAEDCFDGLASTTTVDGRFKIVRRNCCQTDVCNEGSLLLENYETLKPNGLQCPGCFALGDDYCEANQTVNCVGEEDQCLTLNGSTRALNYIEKYTYEGCTTNDSCSHPVGPSLEAGGILMYSVTTKLECRNATSPEPDDDQ